MKISIYDDKMQNVVKTYESSQFKLPFGVIEDLLGLFNGDLFSNNPNVQAKAILHLVTAAFGELKNILTMIFPELTDDDLNHVDVMEVMELMKDVLGYASTLIGMLVNQKN